MMNRIHASASYIGRARVLETADPRPAPTTRPIDAEAEIERFMEASRGVRARYQMTLASTHNRALAAAVRFHDAIVGDPDLAAEVRRRILEEPCAADQAVEAAYGKAIDAIGNNGGYIGARSEDFREVRDRLMEKMLGAFNEAPRLTFTEPTVVVCERITLFLLSRFEPDHVVAVLAASGGINSHAAIALASEGIPLLIDPGYFASVHDGEIIAVVLSNDLLDDPSNSVLPSCFDDSAIEVAPLVNALSETRRAGFSDFSGIGLFRTEFAILGTGRFPSVEEQLKNYRLIAATMPAKPICFRLYDIAPDKPIAHNPNHLYGARYLVEHPAVLDDQLTALLILSAERPIEILVPMVETAADWRFIAGRAALCAERVRDLSGSTPLVYRLGAMIETRRAIAAMSEFQGAAFFSIGSNDLSADLSGQLRTDRADDANAFLDPAFQNALLEILAIAAGRGIPVSLCGAAADGPDAIRLALRAGIRRFLPSVAAAYAVYPSIIGR